MSPSFKKLRLEDFWVKQLIKLTSRFSEQLNKTFQLFRQIASKRHEMETTDAVANAKSAVIFTRRDPSGEMKSTMDFRNSSNNFLLWLFIKYKTQPMLNKGLIFNE